MQLTEINKLGERSEKYGQRCKVRSCPKVILCKGVCNRHYIQLRKYKRIVNILPSTKDKRPAIIQHDIARIPLGVSAKSGYAIVDKEFSYLDKYNWYLETTGYARTFIKHNPVFLHRLIVGKTSNGECTDHINRDKLDNRKSNLRIVPHYLNLHNTLSRKKENIYWDKNRNKWRVIFQCAGLPFHSRFSHKDDALKVRDEIRNIINSGGILCQSN